MVYTQLFHSKIGKLRILIDMTQCQAIAEQSNDATQIITANDTYTVEETFEFVEHTWIMALLAEKNDPQHKS